MTLKAPLVLLRCALHDLAIAPHFQGMTRYFSPVFIAR